MTAGAQPIHHPADDPNRNDDEENMPDGADEEAAAAAAQGLDQQVEPIAMATITTVAQALVEARFRPS